MAHEGGRGSNREQHEKDRDRDRERERPTETCQKGQASKAESMHCDLGVVNRRNMLDIAHEGRDNQARKSIMGKTLHSTDPPQALKWFLSMSRSGLKVGKKWVLTHFDPLLDPKTHLLLTLDPFQEIDKCVAIWRASAQRGKDVTQSLSCSHSWTFEP